jgi:hypothetical protein
MNMPKHGGMISTEEDFHPSELSGNPTSSHLAKSRHNGNDEFGLAKYFGSYLLVFLYAVKSYDMRPTALLPLRRNAFSEFLSAGFEPANVGSNAKHANHYITVVTGKVP